MGFSPPLLYLLLVLSAVRCDQETVETIGPISANKVSCPIDIVHSEVIQTPESLYKLLNSKTTLNHVHPLAFRYNEDEFDIDFRPSIAVLTPGELVNRSKHLSSYCNFKGGNRNGFRAWLSSCDPEEIDMMLHADMSTFQLKQENNTFSLESMDPKSCEILWTRIRERKDSVWHPTHQSEPDYYHEYRHLTDRRRFIELGFFVDKTYTNGASDQEAHRRALDYTREIINMANSFLDSLRIEIRLVHFHLLPIALNLYSKPTVIETFTNYLKQHYATFPFDHATVIFDGEFTKEDDRKILAAAFTPSMCAKKDSFFSTSFLKYQSGGTRNHYALGATLAHELGHTLSMEHDDEWKSKYQDCECPSEKCIMAESAYDNRQFWSSCSLKYLDLFYKAEADYCLWNEPKAEEVPVCGNGIVESGEQCDCGDFGCVSHNCCTNHCTFNEGAECASGACCDLSQCKPKQSGIVCREELHQCDVEEYCDGSSSECPVNEHKADFEPCDDNDAICYNGRCGSRYRECEIIWGRSPDGTIVVPDISPEAMQKDRQANRQNCYMRNTMEGGCGANTPCSIDDILCGRLMCIPPSQETQPLFQHRYNVEHNWSKLGCMLAVAQYDDGFVPKHHMGMVPDGTSCGEDKFCKDRKCVPKAELV